MSNASKILLISAAVLIGIVLISVGIKIIFSTRGIEDKGQEVGLAISDKSNDVSEHIISSTNKIENIFHSTSGSGGTGSNNEIVQWGEVSNKPSIEGEKIGKLPKDLKVGDYVNYMPTTGVYTVAAGEYGSGYTVNQTFTTETGVNALKWRVLAIDKDTGKIELVSATSAQTTTKLYLRGVDGYNHGVDILNDLCEKLYSNEKGAIARSINIEDINSKTTYDYTTYNIETFKYGDTIQLSTYGTEYMQYPRLYSQEKGYGNAGTFNKIGLRVSDGKNDGVTDANGVTTYSTVRGSIDGNVVGTDPYITYMYYNYDSENYLNMNLGANTAPKGLIKIGTTYWLASRSAHGDTAGAYFGICCLHANLDVCAHHMFSSGGGIDKPGYSIRPVVSLSSNVILTKDTVSSTDEVIYWNIEY